MKRKKRRRRIYRKHIVPMLKKIVVSVDVAWRYVSWPIRKRLRKLRNTVHWLPIIWEDQQWDEYYLYRIFQHKFELMENYFRYKGMTVSAEKDADEMKVCRLLCKRLKEENYTTPYDKRNETHLDWFRGKFEESFTKEPDENGFITVVSHDEPDEPEARWILPAHEHEEKMIEQDIGLLCKIIRKHIRGWWD